MKQKTYEFRIDAEKILYWERTKQGDPMAWVHSEVVRFANANGLSPTDAELRIDEEGYLFRWEFFPMSDLIGSM